MPNGFFVQIESMNNVFLGTDVKGFNRAGTDNIGIGGRIIFQKHDFFIKFCFFELIHFGEKILIKCVVHFGDIVNAT